MSKSSIANVNIAVDTWTTLITRANQLVESLRTEVVTANSEANGSLTTGNAFVIGILGANTVVVPTALRGGNVQASGTLNITSPSLFSGNVTVNSSATFVNVAANVAVTSSNVYVNATSTTLAGNTLSIPANTVTFTSNTITLDDVNVNSNLIIRSDLSLIVAANSDIGSTTASAVNVFSFAKASYSSGKITAQAKKGTNTQISEIIVVHDTTTNTALLTVYGTIAAPSGANVGVYGVTTNATHVILQFQQSQVNSSLKFNANLIK